MYMSTRKIKGRWYVDFRYKGNRYRKAAQENTKTSALILERQMRDEAVLMSSDSGIAQAKYASYSDFLVDWMEIYVKANNRPSEQRKKHGIIQKHLVPQLGTLRLQDIGEREIEELKRDKLEEGLAPKTIKNIQSVIRKSLDTAVQWGNLTHVPNFTWIKVPKTEVQVISQEAEDKLLSDESNPLWNTMIVVALKTGMRLGEILALRLMDLDFDGNTIRVNGSMNVEHERAPTKNGRNRTIPMSYDVRSSLKKRMQPESRMIKELFIFDRGDGKPHSMYAAGRMLKKVAKGLGIQEHVHWHKLRHTFATNVAKRGISMRILQELMGHSTILMTERYSHVDMQSKQSAIHALDYATENFGPNLGRNQSIKIAQNAKHSRERLC